jgi:hypothetical protein
MDSGMAEPPDDILQKMRLTVPSEPASVGGRGKRSKLFRWLDAHADDFQAFLDERNPSWTFIAQSFEGTDVADGTGKPPSATRARKVWLEVRQSRGLAPPSKARTKPQPTAPPTAPTSSVPRPSLKEKPRDQTRPTGFTFDATPKENERDIWKGNKGGKGD